MPLRMSSTRTGPLSRAATQSWLSYAVVAVICYLPVLLTKPGVVSDDTKTYLYYDPGRYTKAAVSIWDPGAALGTVTHQNVGYLFPMGPFFWFFSAVHVPVWVAQRLWLGSILFVAAAGVLYLCAVLEIKGSARIIAALAYGLAPYVMQYSGRISVILLPFSGLGFMMAFIILSGRYRGWRYPALFALTVAAVSSINATSIVYVGVAPLLWILYSTFVLREMTGREALGLVVRTGALTFLACLWWLVGLSIEGLYGVDILKYTESVEATSSASSASEVIRGLGYWYFYGGDRLGLWTSASEELTTRVPLLAVTYFVPLAAFVSAVFVRFKHRAFFVLLLVVGLVLSVGAFPFQHPTPFGGLFKSFMTSTTIGLALRSTDRATPLVTLSLAMLLGMGMAAVASQLRRHAGVISLAVGVVILAANAPLMAGRAIIQQFSQPAKPPSYVTAAARYLNSHNKGTRVYALPGQDFAAYTFGDTVDPIWPAVLTRPFVTHEQQIYGSLDTANLLYALDNPLQQGTMDWRALAPIARLMSAGNVLVEYDQQYARYNAPRPLVLEHELAHMPPGLSHYMAFGPPTFNAPSVPMFDELYYTVPTREKNPSPLVVYSVSNPRPIVRAESLSDPLVIDGDSVGVVEAADQGLLADNPMILFSGTLDEDPAVRKAVERARAELVLTDSNRKEAFEWNSLSENTGFTETAHGGPGPGMATDPGFDLFPGAPVTSDTTTILAGVRQVTASSYGTIFTLRSEYRPANAIDSNVDTSWQTDGTATSPIAGQWWQETLDHPVTADSVRLTQPLPQRNALSYTNQYITRVTLTFDGREPETVDLGPQSRTRAGQEITFPTRRFSTLRIRIDATNFSGMFPEPVGASLVGLANVQLDDIHATQIIALPSDLLARVGTSSLADRLAILLERDRVAPVPPRQSPEAYMIREWKLPTARSFSLVGEAHLSTRVPDDLVDSLVGMHAVGPGDPVVAATSSSRIADNDMATAGATLEGKPGTPWMPGLGDGANTNSFLDYDFARPLTVNHLDLVLSSDERHSVPATVVVTAGGVSRAITLPHVPVTSPVGTTTTVPISFPAVRGSSLEIRFPTVNARRTISYETGINTSAPIGVAEVDIPGVAREAVPARIPSLCRSNLLEIDGKAVSIRLTGSAAGALDGDPLAISLCGKDVHGISLGAGTHILQAADGAITGFNLDELALDSAPGGAAMALSSSTQLAPGAPGMPKGGPSVKVLSQSPTEMHLRIGNLTRTSKSFMLVLGESHDLGWAGSVAGGGSLGHALLVDGFANGWRITASDLTHVHHGDLDVVLRFFPQKELNISYWISLATALVCLLLVVWSLFKRRKARRNDVAPLGLDAVPAVVSPISEATARKSLKVVFGTTVLAGALAFFFAGPVAGVIVAVMTLAALRLRLGRAMLTGGALVAMIVAVGSILAIEEFDRWPAGSGWPSHFTLSSEIVWIAVLLLAADAGIELVRRRNAGHRLAASVDKREEDQVAGD